MIRFTKLGGIILVLPIFLPLMTTAIDFGVAGQTFNIVEEPFIEMLKKRLDKVDIEAEQKKIQQKARNQVENPTPVKGIQPAQKNRVFYFDPSYTLDKDIVLPCGKILHRAGTSVNPLEIMNLDRRLFFVDGRVADQIEWLKLQLKSSLPVQKNQSAQEDKENPTNQTSIEDRVILIGGSVFKLQKELGDVHADKVYFDQAGELTTKFGIKASPAIVVQDDLLLKIKEMSLSN